MKKTVLSVVSVTAISLLMACMGCQLNTQEAVPAEAPLKLSGPTENCFGPSLKTFENYFLGSSKLEDVDAAFTCVGGALDMFATYGRGTTERDSFSAVELRAFLERYFLGSIKVNDSFLRELMLVKQALLGGGSDRLTKTELLRLTQVLETLRVEAQRLRPYVNILNQRESVDGHGIDGSLLEQALSDFSFSMGVVGSLLGQSQEAYRIENLKNLLLEIQALYAGRSDWKGPDWFAKQTPLMAATKAVLIRPDGGTIQPGEWKILFSHIGRLYGLYLRFLYMIENRDLFYGEGLRQIEIAVYQISDVFEDAIEAQELGRIDYLLLQDFLTALGDSKAFNLPLRTETMIGLLKPLLDRIFNPVVIDSSIGTKLDPDDRLSAKGYRVEQGGLTVVNLEQIRNMFLGWVEMQQLWEQLEKEAVAGDPSLGGGAVPIELVRKIWSSVVPHHRDSWIDLKSILDRPLPPLVDASGRLVLVPARGIPMDRNSFASLNWKQQVVRTIGSGYVSDPEGLRMKGILSSQLKAVLDDFWDLTLDLKFLDKTDGEIWKMGFTISNIFLFSSNGDDRLGFQEAVDLFVFSFASNVISKQTIRVDVHENCELLDLDPAGLPKIKTECWRERFQKGYQSFFSSMPGWTKLAKKFKREDWERFFRHSEKASRKANNPRGPLMSSEMDRVVSIHHYIEALFMRWDLDRDGRLSFEEADKAYYLFRTILRDASGFSKDEEVRALYFYLLTFGEPPDSLGNKLYWLWWRKEPDEWPKRVSADRRKLLQIFGNLASKF